MKPTNWKLGKLARNTLVLSFGLGLRVLAQALVFLIIARALGTEGYGAYTAILAVAGTLTGFCGLGGHVLLVRDVACDPARFPHSWGCALKALAWSIPFAFALYLITAWTWLPENIPKAAVVLIGVGELIFSPLANVAFYAYQGYERIGRSARMMLIPVIARLVGALVFFLVGARGNTFQSLLFWSWCYALATLFAAIYAHHRVHRDLGSPVFPQGKALWHFVRNGLPFSFWSVAEKLYIDADKLMLARLSSLDDAGIYSAGYRVVDLVFLPMNALLTAAAPRLFRAGQSGIGGSLSYATNIGLMPLIYALTAGCGLVLVAPLLPYLLDTDYGAAVTAVRWLAWLPLASLPRLLMQYALATAALQKLAMGAVMLGACLNIALNLWWIPRWGWQGAAAATYAAEFAMALSMAAIVVLNKRKLSQSLRYLEKST